jgi:hypothetical protein
MKRRARKKVGHFLYTLKSILFVEADKKTLEEKSKKEG